MADAHTFYKEQVGQAVAGDYEAARWNASPLKHAQYEMTKEAISRHALPLFREASSILEVGPGPGTWTKLLMGENAKASFTLVDLSRDMLGMAKEALAGSAQVSFVESDFLAFPEAATYGGFFSSRAIEYFDYRKAVAKIARLLAPGAPGVIITKTPKPLFDRLKGRASAMHLTQIPPAALVAALRKEGLRVTKVRIATATVPGFGSRMLNMLAFKLLTLVPLPLLSAFSESYLVAFEKPRL